MKNIRTKYYYECSESFENRGSKGKYIEQNLRQAKNSDERKGSQEVIMDICNAFIKDKLLSGKKELLFNEKIIKYTFMTKLDNETIETIEIDIPTRIKDGIYCELVRDDIEKLDKLTQLGKKEEKSNRTNKIIAALIGLGIAVSTCIAFKTAIEADYKEKTSTQKIDQIDRDVLENVFGEDNVDAYMNSKYMSTASETEIVKTYKK